jgi:hypothetical protein
MAACEIRLLKKPKSDIVVLKLTVCIKDFPGNSNLFTKKWGLSQEQDF